MSFSFNSEVKSLEMQSISSWKDFIPFAGEVVAYKTNSCYLDTSKGYSLDDKSIKFGYIPQQPNDWCGGEKGYNMKRLIKPEEKHDHCALIDSELGSLFLIRLALNKEIKLIHRAILMDQACFEHSFDKQRVLEILKKKILVL